MSLKKANASRKRQELTFDYDEVKEFIKKHKTAKIYFGCDSTRLKRKRVRFATLVCIHYEGHKGAKVFGEVTYEKLVDAEASKPINRMLAEVQKVIEMFDKFEEVLIERLDDVSIHLDINPNENAGSNIAYGAAKGMIQGMIGLEPIFKPNAWVASFAADRYCNV